MILLTKLNGDVFAVNPSFVTRIEQHKDTIVFTRDGNDVMVQESLDDIVDQLRSARASVLAHGIALAAATGVVVPVAVPPAPAPSVDVAGVGVDTATEGGEPQ